MKDDLRFKILCTMIFLLFGVTAIKLAQAALIPDERLRSGNTRSTSVRRGNIYDRKGRLIAGASATKSLFVRPARLSPELKNYIRSFLKNTGYFSDSELRALSRDESNFAYIKRGLPPSVTEPIIAMLNEIKKNGWMQGEGIGLETEESRFYPYPFLSPVVGNINRDGVGVSGIEFTMNDALKLGDNVTLSIDAEFSRIASEELLKGVRLAQAEGGSVAIMDIDNRSLLALVQTQGASAYATSYIYEPGSVMKIFTSAFAMETGIASTSEPLFNDRDAYRVGDYTFSRPAYGMIPLSIMLQKSANISFARLASQFSSSDYYTWLSQLGFGHRPEVPLTGLERGILHPPSKWSALSKPMIAIGQEIGVTTLQLVTAASVIGGGGEAMPTMLITSVRSPKGEEKFSFERERTRLMHPQKSRELIYALENTVKPGGTGVKAAVEGVRVAGKTGTGMIAGSQGYGVGKNNTVFIGFFPVEHPEVAIVVALHNPQGSARSGGGVSAPLFSEITRRILIASRQP